MSHSEIDAIEGAFIHEVKTMTQDMKFELPALTPQDAAIRDALQRITKAQMYSFLYGGHIWFSKEENRMSVQRDAMKDRQSNLIGSIGEVCLKLRQIDVQRKTLLDGLPDCHAEYRRINDALEHASSYMVNVLAQLGTAEEHIVLASHRINAEQRQQALRAAA